MATPSKTVKRACRILRWRIRFRSAGFTLPGNSLNNHEADTEAIRQATERYIESWVIPLIDAIETGDTERLQHAIKYSGRRKEPIGNRRDFDPEARRR